jgi:sporulation protein YlmC with PRC-barrel domain
MVKNNYLITYQGKEQIVENSPDKFSAVKTAAHKLNIPWTQVAKQGKITLIESNSLGSETGAIYQ